MDKVLKTWWTIAELHLMICWTKLQHPDTWDSLWWVSLGMWTPALSSTQHCWSFSAVHPFQFLSVRSYHPILSSSCMFSNAILSGWLVHVREDNHIYTLLDEDTQITQKPAKSLLHIWWEQLIPSETLGLHEVDVWSVHTTYCCTALQPTYCPSELTLPCKILGSF